MKKVRISLALCGMSMALAGAGCHTSGKHGDSCGRQVTPGCATTVVEPGCKSTHASSGLGSCLSRDKHCHGKDKACCEKTACAPACDNSPCCSNEQVCTKPVCTGCGTACGGTCGVVCNESLNTCLGVGIKQQMHVGEVQIDEDKLQKRLDARARTRAEEERRYKEYCAAQENYVNMQREKQLRQYIDTLYGSADCAGRAPICCLPAPPICPELPPPPQCTPLRPAEIPMMIPVTLEVGVEKSHMSSPRVERTCMPACPKTPCGVPSRQCAPATIPAAPAAVPPAPMSRAGQAPVITPASGDAYIQQRSSVR